MNGLGEYRTATIDGLPWQLRLKPTGHCDIRAESQRCIRFVNGYYSAGKALRERRLP